MTPSAGKTDCTTLANHDGKLTGVTTAMEYKLSTADNWISGTGSDIAGLAPGTYLVRIMARMTTLASDTQSLSIRSIFRSTCNDTGNDLLLRRGKCQSAYGHNTTNAILSGRRQHLGKLFGREHRP